MYHLNLKAGLETHGLELSTVAKKADELDLLSATYVYDLAKSPENFGFKKLNDLLKVVQDLSEQPVQIQDFLRPLDSGPLAEENTTERELPSIVNHPEIRNLILKHRTPMYATDNKFIIQYMNQDYTDWVGRSFGYFNGKHLTVLLDMVRNLVPSELRSKSIKRQEDVIAAAEHSDYLTDTLIIDLKRRKESSITGRYVVFITAQRFVPISPKYSDGWMVYFEPVRLDDVESLENDMLKCTFPLYLGSEA